MEMENAKAPESSGQTRNPHIGWVLWLKWTLATALGFAAGSVASLSLVIFNLPLFQVTSWFVLFTCIGTIQWSVLRNRISHAGWWIPATVVGWFLALYMGFNFLGFHVGYALDMALTGGLGRFVYRGVQGAFAGFAVGLLQWSVLRRHVRKAHWWILTTTASVSLGGLLEAALMAARVQLAFPFIFIPLYGIIIGATSGIPLVYLLQAKK